MTREEPIDSIELISVFDVHDEVSDVYLPVLDFSVLIVAGSKDGRISRTAAPTTAA